MRPATYLSATKMPALFSLLALILPAARLAAADAPQQNADTRKPLRVAVIGAGIGGGA